MAANANLFPKIKTAAQKLGFTAAGYAPARPLLTEAVRYNHALENGYFAELEYLKRNCDKRFDPGLLVEGAKSILVFLAPYGKNNPLGYIDILFPGSKKNTTEQSPGEQPNKILQYKVAQYALGEDYHTVIKRKLNLLLDQIKEADPSVRGRIFVDTAPVMERAWAVKAGIGFIGKNNFLISKQHGIRNFIGVIISTLELPNFDSDFDFNSVSESALDSDSVSDFHCPKEIKPKITENHCGSCTRCIDACPTGALSAPYTLDARKCISYLTIEKKDASPLQNKEQAGKRDGWIFGCDACMNACPWNSRNQPGWPEFNQTENPILYTHLKRR